MGLRRWKQGTEVEDEDSRRIWRKDQTSIEQYVQDAQEILKSRNPTLCMKSEFGAQRGEPGLETSLEDIRDETRAWTAWIQGFKVEVFQQENQPD